MTRAQLLLAARRLAREIYVVYWELLDRPERVAQTLRLDFPSLSQAEALQAARLARRDYRDGLARPRAARRILAQRRRVHGAVKPGGRRRPAGGDEKHDFGARQRGDSGFRTACVPR